MKSIVTILFCFWVNLTSSQNLVPNPSFEDTTMCPQFLEINGTQDWMAFRESPDYFNGCANTFTPDLGTPTNCRGHQIPFDGAAYIGLGNYFKTLPGVREHVGVQLNSALISGQKYYISFRVSLADTTSMDCPSNNIGARFTNVLYAFDSYPSPVDNFAHVFTTSIIDDKNGWTKVFGSLIADSVYNYLMLGNFFDDLNTDTVNCSLSTSSVSYYYVDAVCVSTDSIFASQYLEINETEKAEPLLIFPNPFTDYVYISGKDILGYAVFDLTGKLILDGKIPDENVIRLNQLANGTYVLRLFYEKISINKMVIKQ